MMDNFKIYSQDFCLGDLLRWIISRFIAKRGKARQGARAAPAIGKCFEGE